MDHQFPILLAEDNPVSRKVLEKTLLKAGYEVTSVENGRKAFELFNHKFFPMVLTDWMMPEMDGLELCRAIRDSPSQGYVFIILLTAKDSKEDIITGLQAGADDYLTKPVNHTELIARLNAGRRILELERSLKNANEEIRILSITDPLTGSYNRGYLNERLPGEIKRATRYGSPLSLIMSDIDHFKEVNDTHGHLTGDRALRELVQSLRESIRDDLDWVARYGGEEFVIVLPETDVEGAIRLAERMRRNISQRAIEARGKNISITISCGVTGFDAITTDEIISAEAVLNQADDFMYQAKEQGRNRVVGGAFSPC